MWGWKQRGEPRMTLMAFTEMGQIRGTGFGRRQWVQLGSTKNNLSKRLVWESTVFLTLDHKKMVCPGVIYRFGHQWYIDNSWIHENK